MRHSKTRRKYARPALAVAACGLLACVGLLVYARSLGAAGGAYALAADLPRGALVYAQCADLPALLKRWDASPLKEQLLASTAFQQFKQRHLAMKLAERWTEYNDAFGFTLDAAALSGATEQRAAVAIYDIGRLDLVLVAPLTEEQSAASAFFTHTDGFDAVELPDGTTYFRREADVDIGRQRQVLAFAWARGRFVLSTDERLLLRTLANINGRARKDRLADEPAFQTLSRELAPHFVTVWVDQTALNRDWYFKSYWVQRNVEDLQSLRAGLFDLELQTDRWIEHRRFLTTRQPATQAAALPASEAQRLAALAPADAPYYKVRALAGADGAAALVRDTLLERAPEDDAGGSGANWRWQAYDDSDFSADADRDTCYGSCYDSLDESYDRLVDDAVDARLQANDTLYDGELRAGVEQHAVAALERALAPARPVYATTAANPQTNTGPLFVEFQSAAALTLAAPAQLERPTFERALADLAQSRLTIAGVSSEITWTDGAGGGHSWRTFNLPLLGRQLCYALAGRELVVTNNATLLQAILTTRTQPSSTMAAQVEPRAADVLEELTVIRLDQRRQAFDQVFARLDAERIKTYWQERHGSQADDAPPDKSQEFFSGNVASLLDVAARVRTVRITRSRQPGRLREELEFIMQHD